MTSTTRKDEEKSSKEEGRNEFLNVNGNPVYFEEDWDTGIGGGLWSTGMAMAKYFQNHTSEVRHNLETLLLLKGETTTTKQKSGLSVLELGSGNGFLSVCLAALGKGIIKDLVVTDMADHLALMEKTLQENKHLVGDCINNNTNDTMKQNDRTSYVHSLGHDDDDMCVAVMEHRWGEFVEEVDDCHNMQQQHNESHSIISSLEKHMKEGTKKFDFIFGSDLAYRDYLHEPLIASLVQFSHPNTVTLIGVTMSDTKPQFFTSLVNAGFRYDRLADHLMEPEFRGTTFGLIAIQKR
mmetsp:Transcript_16458/g.24426  ORF Transcript_16458/g.24426 Transcript_16458/m.24426 type:complete len:294 (-) Transcript_16458:335-1216(-)